MAAQQLLKIVYALDIKFWVRWCTCSMWRMLLTLSTHAREGYSSHFVCHSLCFSILEKAPFSGLKLTSVCILGDDLSALNVALF